MDGGEAGQHLGGSMADPAGDSNKHAAAADWTLSYQPTSQTPPACCCSGTERVPAGPVPPHAARPAGQQRAQGREQRCGLGSLGKGRRGWRLYMGPMHSKTRLLCNTFHSVACSSRSSDGDAQHLQPPADQVGGCDPAAAALQAAMRHRLRVRLQLSQLPLPTLHFAACSRMHPEGAELSLPAHPLPAEVSGVCAQVVIMCSS